MKKECQILSGMAYGIDTEAHRGALEGEGGTWAVLGNGVDICYPSGNRALYQRILREKCGILSEQPTGTRARNYFFRQETELSADWRILL